MTQQEFLSVLKKRAQEQQALVSLPFPKIFSFLATYLGNHPWRIFIPFALLLSILLHFAVGKTFDDAVLKIFGGFGLIRI